jgi:hypothetical protein
MDFSLMDTARNATQSLVNYPETNNREGIDATVIFVWLSMSLIGILWPVTLMLLPVDMCPTKLG